MNENTIILPRVVDLGLDDSYVIEKKSKTSDITINPFSPYIYLMRGMAR